MADMATAEEQAAAIVRKEAEAVRAHIAEYRAKVAALAGDASVAARVQRANHHQAVVTLAQQAGERAAMQIKKLLSEIAEQE